MASSRRQQHRNRPLKLALTLALILHAGLLLGVGFNSASKEDNYRPQIDVTLAFQPTENAPADATHAAQFNQQGSGDHSPIPQHGSRHSIAIPGSALPALLSEALLLPPRTTQQPQRRDHSLVTRSAAEKLRAAEEKILEHIDPVMAGINPDVDKLNRELAELQASLEEQTQSYSDMPRVRRLTSASTRASVDAAYLHDWRKRVEAVGNQYYPQASIRYGLYGSLRLLVVIDHRGRLDDIRVLSSSGYAVLDEAAMKIVRMAAPYAPFPPELRETADKLEIIRTWQFQENGLSSG